MRLALAVEYAGDGFCGWQSQASGLGVQDALERALASIAGAPVRVVAAGRTDAGVHALSQVVHAEVSVERPLTAWVRGVNAHLPEAAAVLWAQAVEPSFHARFSARARLYSYALLNRPVRPVLFARRVGWYHRPLDDQAMRDALQRLLGTHDFSAFRAAECQARSPVKTLHRAEIERRGDLLLFHFTADAFLHHMIRNILGALVAIGAGKAPARWMGELLEARDRTRGAATFSAAGLYFAGPEYPSEFGLPVTTRAVPSTLGGEGV